ncbi:MAG: sulfite exporter TauE/SafE family protein [Acidobacteriota bacterium]|nr:sulfite exporter TauE/SafE family protein [Acidobacteriota bacterium]
MQNIWLLAGTAATLGFVHTLIGPDHYLPFIVISRARNWSLPKTLLVSFLCGLGHVLSSVVLGFLGIGLGLAVGHLERIEGTRGSIAAWLLIGFGLAYLVWGLRKAYRSRPHEHLHYHPDGQAHAHLHTHEDNHLHIHKEAGENGEKKNITPWVLFLIFVFGPCEPLIPLVMYPAAQHSISGVIIVTAAFGLTTILTMLIIIALSSWGLSFIRLGGLERYSHALAGGIIFISGLTVQFLGL